MSNPDQFTPTTSADVPTPHELRSQERDTVGRLGDFDSEYFQALEGSNGWIALGQEHCRNQRYFTVHGTDGEKLGIVGVYDTDEDEHIVHTIVDPKYRGRGLAAQFKLRLMDGLDLPYLTLTISTNNTASLRAAEKLPGAYKVSDVHYEQEFQKVKFRVERQTEDESLSIIERRHLAETWSRVVLGDRVVAPDASTQTPDEFQQWLYASLVGETDKLIADWRMSPSAVSIERIHAAQGSGERAKAEEAYITECQEVFMQRMRAFRPASERSTKWDSWPEVMRESGEFNCAGAVLIGMRLLEQAGIRQWVGNPVGHVVHIAQLADGSMWYVDFLNRNIQKISPMRTEIAGNPALVLREEWIEYRRVLLREPNETVSIILDNLSAMQHEAHEGAAATDDLDVRAAKSSIARFPGLLDTIDIESLSVKLGSRNHMTFETAEMQAEAKRVETLHAIGDDPRLRAFRDALGDTSAREALARSIRSDVASIQRFLEGEVTTYISPSAPVQQFVEIVRDIVNAKAGVGTELRREIVGIFMKQLRHD